MDLRKMFLKTTFPRQGSFGFAGGITLPGEVPQAHHLPLRMTGRLRAWMMDMV